MPHPYASGEPQWELHDNDGKSYTRYVGFMLLEFKIQVGSWYTNLRPLLGAEQILDQVARLADGSVLSTFSLLVIAFGTEHSCTRHDETTTGLTFTSPFSPPDLASRIREALCRLRLYSPLVAARIVPDIHSSTFRSWLYTPAQDADEVQEWVGKTLRVEHLNKEEAFDPEEFVTKMTSTTIAHDSPIPDQNFYAYLFLGTHPTSTHAFFMHASHAIFDGGAFLQAFRNIFDWASNPSSEEAVGKGKSARDLGWGSEWKNLTPSPLGVVGGIKEGWDGEGRKLVDLVDGILANPTVCISHFASFNVN